MSRNRLVVVMEIALSVALATVLRRLAVWQMPFGGEVSLAMLPLIVIALRRGPVAGMVAGLVFAPIDFLMVPTQIVSWFQPVLDYPLAYAAVGLAGLVSPLVTRGRAESRPSLFVVAAVLGTVIGVSGRFVAHFLSGMFFFATSVFGGPLPAGASPFADIGAMRIAAAYSAVYNATYLLPSLVACAVAAAIVFPVLERTVPVRSE